MLYILHHSDDKEKVEENIFPILEGTENQTIIYPGTDFKTETNAIIVTYLSDELLREFLPKAAIENLKIGILPHPENTYTTKGLGISSDPEKVLEEILSNKEEHKLDMLYCNDIPVFQSVNIGNVFTFTEDQGKTALLEKCFRSLKTLDDYLPFLIIHMK